MKKIRYNIVRAFIKVLLFFYFKKIKCVGKENIPKKGAVLFASNHQNAFLDAILIPTSNTRISYFLTRASAFKNPIVNKILRSVFMLPIYRIGDGIAQLKKNEAIFDSCYTTFNNGEAIQIFPEGNHNLQRRIRPLSKGFTRIIFGALEKYPELNIQIVPVGLNYEAPMVYPSKVSIYYGKPIAAQTYFLQYNRQEASNALKKEVKNALEKLSTHIDHEPYDEYEKYLHNVKADFLNPIATNEQLKGFDPAQMSLDVKSSNRSIFYFLMVINSIIPWCIWRYIKPKIEEKEFMATFRFAYGVVAFSLFYFVQAFVLEMIFPCFSSMLYLIASYLIVLLSSKV